MSKPQHLTPGFEQDLDAAIKRWGVDRQMTTPASVLASYVMGCLTGFETALRRRADFARAEGRETHEHVSVVDQGNAGLPLRQISGRSPGQKPGAADR